MLSRNRKLEIATAPRKAKSREPAYSQALVQNKIRRQRWMVFGVETGREVGRVGLVKTQEIMMLMTMTLTMVVTLNSLT